MSDRFPHTGRVPQFAHLLSSTKKVAMVSPSKVPSETSVTPDGVDERRSKRALKRAFVGFAVDYYDIYLPVVALAPALSYFQPANLSPAMTLSLFYLTFAATLVARPIGAAVFGSLADRIGRRKVTLISMIGFGVATLLIAFIPGYTTIGIFSYLLLILLRFIDGLFLGGEYTSANPLAMESAPRARRGLYGGIIGSAYPFAYIAISLVTALMLVIFPSGSPDSAYSVWGWRIPFVIGALLAFAVVIYFRQIEESEVWEKVEAKTDVKKASPLKELFTGTNRKSLAQVMVLMTGLWFITNSVISAVPALFISTLKLSSSAVTNTILLLNFVVAIGYLSSGLIGQKWGRRRYFIGAGITTVIVGAPAFYFALNNIDAPGWFVGGMLLYGLALLVSTSCYGVIHTYVIERFPTEVRATGYGVGYSLSILIPSFYGFYMTGLGTFMPYRLTPLPLFILGGLLMAIGAWMGPETRDLDFRREVAATPTRTDG